MEQYVRTAVIAFCLWSVPCQLLAQSPDIEAMKRSLEAQISVFQRLNELERRVTDLERQKGGDPPESSSIVTPSTVAQDAPSSGAGQVSETPASEFSNTSVCQCQGYKHHLCHCLKAGVTCRCSRSIGSVWEMENGRAVRKTGRYIDPRKTQRPGVDEPLAVQSHAPGRSGDAAVPALRNDGRWWWTAPGGVHWWAASQPKNGDSVVGNGVTWDCVDGRMVQRGAKMAAVVQPAGHWEKRCVGGVCRMYWIAD